jgi:hypothetical protein
MRVVENSDQVVTYISRQNVESGPTLKPEDHDVLVKELEKLAHDTKCTIEIVPHTAPWQEKLSAILRSTVHIPILCLPHYMNTLLSRLFWESTENTYLTAFT